MFKEKVKTTVTTFIKLPNFLTQNSWSLKWSKKKNQRPYLTRNTSRTRIVIDYRVWMQGIKFKVEELLSLMLFCQHITRFLLTPLFCDSGNKYRSKHHGNEALVYGYIYISLPSSLFVRLCCDIICFDNFVAYQRKQVSWQTNSRLILIKIAVRHTTRIFWIEIYQSHDIKSARSKSGQLIFFKYISNLTFPQLHIFAWLKNKIHT